MAGSAEKRPREAAGSPPNEERRTKRRRWDTDADPAENNPAPVAPAVTAAPDKTAAAAGKTTVPKQDALAKAKAVLAKQKALAEKLKKANIPVNTTATPSTQSDAVKKALEVAERTKQKKQNAAATSVGRGAPRALRLNAKGEEIDEDGKVVESANVKEISTFAINAKSLAQKEKQAKFDLFAALQRETAAEVYAGDERFVGRRRDRKEFQVRRLFFSSVDTSHTFPQILCIHQSPAVARSGRNRHAGTTAMRNATRRCRVTEFEGFTRIRPSTSAYFPGAFLIYFEDLFLIDPPTRTPTNRKLHSVARTTRFSLQFLCLPDKRRRAGNPVNFTGDPFAWTTFSFCFLFSFFSVNPRVAADEVR